MLLRHNWLAIWCNDITAVHLVSQLCYDVAVIMSFILAPAVRLYFKDKWILASLISAILLCAIAAAIFLIYLPRQENIILHYNVYFGIDLLGNWYESLLIPLAGFFIVAINGLVGIFIWRRDRVISYLLGIGSFFIAVIVMTSAALLVYLNI